MGRRVDVDLLVDARRITELLAFPRVQLVHYYLRTDPDFPRPVFTPSATTGSFVWYWPDVRRWAVLRERLPDGNPDPRRR